MEMNERTEQIIYRFLIGDIENSELQGWLNENPENGKSLKKICEELKITEEGKIFYQLDDELAWLDCKSRLQRSRVVSTRNMLMRNFFRYVAIIVLPLMTALGGWILYQQQVGFLSNRISQNIVPGDYRAVLVLSDGVQKVLEGEVRNEVEVVDGVKVKRNRQILRYDSISQTKMIPERWIYNILKTPRGGEFQIVLSDGTKVWMNSDSQLRYPVHFSGTERRVFLSGEAYFEVYCDSCRPFYVVTDDVYVRVYGTAFNVNTQRISEVQTVLVKGSVGVGRIGSKEEVRLKPGERASFICDNQRFIVDEVNTAQYIAWKEGYFAFENESLEEIMEMLGRWYDVDVFYASNDLKCLKFTGYLRKYEDITRILEAIHEVVGVQFSIKDQTIVVSK